MNHLWTIYFHDLIVFVNSQDRISKEIMSTLTFQAFFISFLLLVFLIETSGNSISFLAVIIVDVLLVYFNHDKCYNNECIYYYQLHYITFLGRCEWWWFKKWNEFYFNAKICVVLFYMLENQDNFVFAMSHIFHLLCDFIDDRFQKWKEFLPYEQKCIGN